MKLEKKISKYKTYYVNEYMTSFLNLRVFQNEAEAMKELKPGLYSDFSISVAKNYSSINFSVVWG